MSKDIKRRVTGEVPRTRTGETVQADPTPPQPTVEPPRRRPTYSKGDGITTDKPRLPSVENPEAPRPSAPRPRPSGPEPKRLPPSYAKPSGPEPKRLPPSAKPADLELKPKPLQVSSKPIRGRPISGPGYGKGDGITTDKPTLPRPDAPGARNELVSSEQPVFRAKPGVLGLSPLKSVATSSMREALKTSATSTAEIPPELLPITKENALAFQEAYIIALKAGEQWALDLHDKAIEEDQKLQDEAMAIEEARGEPAIDEDGRGPRGPKLSEYERRLRILAMKGEPWVHAAAAEQVERRKKLDLARNSEVVDVDFDPKPPDRLSHQEWRRLNEEDKRTGQLKHTDIPTAADGSILVPPINGKYVTEYVRTNPAIEELRRGSAANMWNPLYAFHLQAAIGAEGAKGAPPPEGKGFLAMTEHGFAYCWNPKLSAEENRKVAEFSLRTGMLFEKCDGMNDAGQSLDDALRQLNQLDPTKPGEVKILLDKHGKGKDKISIKVDADGNVTTKFYTRLSATEKWKDGLEKYGLAAASIIAGVVAMVIPGAQAGAAAAWSAAAGYLGAAAAVQSAYNAAKSGDWAAAVLALATAYAGFGQQFFKPGTTAFRFAQAAGNVAKAIGGIKTIVASIENKDLAGALGGVANAASSVATIAGTHGAPEVQAAFEKIAKYAEKYGKLAAFGAAGVKALENGDYLAALGYALETVGGLDAEFKLSESTVRVIRAASEALKGAGAAVADGDYAGAVAHILEGVDGYFDRNDPAGAPDPRSRTEKIVEAGITVAGMVSELKKKDPLAAAKLLGEFVKKLWDERAAVQKEIETTKEPGKLSKLRAWLKDIEAQLEKFGGAEKLFEKASTVYEAIKKKDYAGALVEATSLAAQLTQNGYDDAAAEVLRAAKFAAEVVKRGGSFEEIMLAQKRLGEALQGAVGLFDKEPNLDISEQLQGAIDKERQGLTDARGDLEALRAAGKISEANYQCALEALEAAEVGLTDAAAYAKEGKEPEANAALKRAKAKLEEAVAFSTAGNAPPDLVSYLAGVGGEVSSARAYLLSLDRSGKISAKDLGAANAALAAAEAELAEAEKKLAAGDAEGAQRLADSAKEKIEQAYAIARGKESEAPGKTHVVAKGESLYELAKRYLGSGERWPELYAFNRAAIGPNPSALKEGVTLEIPPSDFRLSAAERSEILALETDARSRSDAQRALSAAEKEWLRVEGLLEDGKGQVPAAKHAEAATLQRDAGKLLDQAKQLLERGQVEEAKKLIDSAKAKLGGAERILKGSVPTADSAREALSGLGDRLRSYADALNRIRNDPSTPKEVHAQAATAVRYLNDATALHAQAAELLQAGKVAEAESAILDAELLLAAAASALPAIETDPASAVHRNRELAFVGEIRGTLEVMRAMQNLGGVAYGSFLDLERAANELERLAKNPSTSAAKLREARAEVDRYFNAAIAFYQRADNQNQAVLAFLNRVLPPIKTAADLAVDILGGKAGPVGMAVKVAYNGIVDGIEGYFTPGGGWETAVKSAIGGVISTALTSGIEWGVDDAGIKGVEKAIAGVVEAFVGSLADVPAALDREFTRIDAIRPPLSPTQKQQAQNDAVARVMKEAAAKFVTKSLKKIVLQHIDDPKLAEWVLKGAQQIVDQMVASAIQNAQK